MMPQLLTLLGRPARNRAGVAAVEFALIAPVLITLLGAAVDLGFAIERSIRLENAARTGAQFATRAPNQLAGAQAAALATLSDWGDVSVPLPTIACLCPDATGVVTGTPSPGTCSTTCTNGMAQYISVTATRPFTPILPTSAFVPFNALGASSSNVVARLQ